jgi:hypothetical protein
MRCGLFDYDDRGLPHRWGPRLPSSRRGKTPRWDVPTFHIRQQSWRCLRTEATIQASAQENSNFIFLVERTPCDAH